MNCPVCALPQRGHPPCAICQSTNAHLRICSWCKTQPYNKGWRHTWEELGTEGDINDSPNAPTMRLADLIDSAPLDVTEAQTEIVRLALVGEKERYHYRDRRGRWRGWRVRIRPLSLREIGHRTGRHWTYVSRVLKRYGVG